MKKYILPFFSLIILIGCSENKNPKEHINVANVDISSEIEELQNENSKLKEELQKKQEETNTELLMNNFKDTLNITFKLISAMSSKDYEFIESVISNNIEVSRNKNIFIVNNTNGSFEVPFVKNIELNQLEIRAYESIDENRVRLFISKVNNQKGAEGYSELNFEFVRSEDNRWLLDQFITN